MEKNFKSFVSILLAFVCVLGILPSGLFAKSVLAAPDPGSITYSITSYGTPGSTKCGYIVAPNMDGNFPVMILMHGNSKPNDNLAKAVQGSMPTWSKEFGIKPMIFVLPSIYTGAYHSSGVHDNDFMVFVKSYMGDLIKDIQSKSLVKNADTSKGISVAGFSMGGAAAVYAGCKYKDSLVNVAGLSPAQQALYYTDPNDGWMVFDKSIQPYQFAKPSNGVTPVLFLTSSYTEQNGERRKSIERYMEGFGNANGFQKLYFATGGHDLRQCMLGLLCFTFMIQNNGKIPSQQLLSNGHYLASKTSFGNTQFQGTVPSSLIQTTIPQDTTKPTLTGKVSMSGSLTVGSTLTVSVSGCNCDAADLEYMWETDSILNGKKGQTYVVREEDVGKYITCCIRDKKGNYDGYLHARFEKGIAKNSSTTKPALTGTVTMSGSLRVGSTLKVSVSGCNCNTDDLEYLWESGSILNGKKGPTYTITSADKGKYITCCIRDKKGRFVGYIHARFNKVK